MKLRSKYLADAARAFDRAPVEVALALVSAALISYCIHADIGMDECVRFLIAAAIAGLFAWRSTLLSGLGAVSVNQRWTTTLVGAALGAAYLLLVPDIDPPPASEGWRAFLLMGATFLFAFAAPGWTPRAIDNASLRLRRINGRVILRAIGSVLYGLALFAGLALAVVAIDKLFELGLKSEVYGHLFVWIMVVLVPWVIVGGLDDYVRPLDEQSDVARVVHRMTTFLVPPLIALYFIILYTYALRIAVTHELPQNLVSPMVIAAGLLVALGLVLFDPQPDAKGGQRLLRYAPAVFLPLAPLGLWALAARIDQYGWTEFRLLRVVVLVMLLGLAVPATLQLVRRRPFALRVIPLVFSLILFLSAVGPWGVLPIARRDQQHRLAAGLREAGIDPGKPPRDSTRHEISGALYQRITGSAIFLRAHFGERAVAEVLPEFARMDPRGFDVAGFYHLVPKTSSEFPRMLFGQLPPGVGVRTGDGGTVYRIGVPPMNKGAVPPRVVHDSLFMQVGGDTLVADLRPVMTAITGNTRGDGRIPPEAAFLAVNDMRGVRRGYLTVLEINVDATKALRVVQRLDGLLTIRP